MSISSRLPQLSVGQRLAARPATLTGTEQAIVAMLGAEALCIDGVLWVLFPSLEAARDPRANELPVHIPGHRSAPWVDHGGDGLFAQGAGDE